MRLATTAFIFSTSALLVACAEEAHQVPELFGEWESAPVVLDRGEFTETYLFNVSIDSDSSSGVMDITYYVTDDPRSERLVRQDIVVETQPVQILLTGSNPRLAAGPEIIGVYESDTLACVSLTAAHAGSLTCKWGSDAHGDGPEVLLRRQ